MKFVRIGNEYINLAQVTHIVDMSAATMAVCDIYFNQPIQRIVYDGAVLPDYCVTLTGDECHRFFNALEAIGFYAA